MAARKISRKASTSVAAARVREAIGSATPIKESDPLRRRSEEIDRRLRELRAQASSLVEAIY